jgi:hypothetical protein
MKRWRIALIALVMELQALPGGSKDLLPIRHGVYVDEDIPCASAPWGNVITYFDTFGYFYPSVCKLRKIRNNLWSPSCFFLRDYNGRTPAPTFKGSVKILAADRIYTDDHIKRWCAATIDEFVKN